MDQSAPVKDESNSNFSLWLYVPGQRSRWKKGITPAPVLHTYGSSSEAAILESMAPAPRYCHLPVESFVPVFYLVPEIYNREARNQDFAKRESLNPKVKLRFIGLGLRSKALS